MPKLVVGIVGLPNAGKGEARRIIKSYFLGLGVSCDDMSFSDVLGRWLDELGIPRERKNYQLLPKIMHQTNWQGIHDPKTILSRAVSRKISESKADVFIADGMRWDPFDHDIIVEFPVHSILAVEAPRDLLFKRMAGNPRFPGNLTRRMFETIMKRRTERDIPKLIEKATYRIENNGPIEHFQVKVLGYAELILFPKLLP